MENNRICRLIMVVILLFIFLNSGVFQTVAQVSDFNSFFEHLVEGEKKNEEIFNQICGVALVHKKILNVHEISNDNLKLDFKFNEEDIPLKFIFFRFGKNERFDALFNLSQQVIPHIVKELPILSNAGDLNTVFLHGPEGDCEFVTGYSPERKISPDEHKKLRIGNVRKYNATHENVVSAKLFDFFYPVASSFKILGQYKVSELVQMAHPKIEMVDISGEKLLSISFRIEHDRLKQGMSGESQYEILLDTHKSYSIRRYCVETINVTSKLVALSVVDLEPVGNGFLPSAYQSNYVNEDKKTGKSFTMKQLGKFYYSPNPPNEDLFMIDSLRNYGYDSVVVDYIKDSTGTDGGFLQGRDQRFNGKPSSHYGWGRIIMIAIGLLLMTFGVYWEIKKRWRRKR
jgi:hypothetical protein